MALVKLKNRGHKREVVEKKSALYGSAKKIEDNLTLEERNMQYKLIIIAEEERNNEKEGRSSMGFGMYMVGLA